MTKLTRRSKSWKGFQGKSLVDNGTPKGVDLAQGIGGPDKASSSTEGTKIDDDVWSEMITVGKLLCLTHEDPDTYDLFNWMRIHIFSGQPYSNYLLARVDAEIANELGPWDTN